MVLESWPFVSILPIFCSLMRASSPSCNELCVKGPPPWSKEKEEKEMRDVVHENANLAGKACCCVLSF